MKKLKLFGLLMASTLLFIGCGKSSEETKEQDAPLKIVTTFYPMYDFASHVAKEHADVSMLIDGGVEPHDYEPSAKDMAKIQDADVFIYNSKEMETWVDAVLASIDQSNVVIVEASEGIDLLDSEEHDHEAEEEQHEGHEEHEHGEHDPHVWLSPVLAQQEVATITEALVRVDKANQTSYEENSRLYKEELVTLDKEYQEMAKEATFKTFVTQHAAFSYLAHEYGLEQVSISGINPDQEPTPKELKHIEDTVNEQHIAYIYTESSATPKIAKTISDATGAELLTLNPMESLPKAQREKGENYLTVMRENMLNLKKSIK